MPKWITKRTVLLTLLLIGAILTTIYILPLAIPLILALATAFLLEPLVKYVQKTFKWTRKLAVTTVFTSFLIIISTLVYWIITQLVAQIIQLTKAAPGYFKTLGTLWSDVQEKMFSFTKDMPTEVVDSIQSQIISFVIVVQKTLLNIFSYDSITNILTEIPNFLVSFLVYLVALFLIMLDLTELKKSTFRHLSPSSAEKMRFMMTRLNTVAFGFIKAQIVLSLIIFISSLIGLWIIAPKYAIIMSIIIWIVDIIPILGSIIIVAPWAIYYYATGDNILATKLAIFGVFLIIIRRTTEPKVMGSQIGLSPLATLIAMFIGLKLLGAIGLFLGPLLLIIFNTAKEAGIIKFDFKI